MTMQNERTTSAGYRLPIGQTSAVHRIAPRPPVTQGTGKKGAREVEKLDEVSFNKIWREQIHSEWKGVQDWNTQWGFMKDFDPRGRPKTPKELPEKEAVFSDTVPDTQGHVYGSRINTEIGEQMTKMEFLFHSSNRRCRLDTEFVCY